MRKKQYNRPNGDNLQVFYRTAIIIFFVVKNSQCALQIIVLETSLSHFTSRDVKQNPMYIVLRKFSCKCDAKAGTNDGFR